ncbi:MAG: hypothetical protein B6D72_14860 [gamma proteobacterium symbiont of Ctena orbiculata]|nr:MAG: hypothetical protein B6D72_14860 [gamma proteobacterium symbiont of Ctena orbiculata]PVV16230.1 MAG: hypothetical protein B6D82_01565 [gamma proteobacterium symbiont of Ctena orbiculata]PVV20951.1 MAG: hypothetical protein B6D74_12430 [gamma proteobacterium symbiont of Ctena orbiculata]
MRMRYLFFFALTTVAASLQANSLESILTAYEAKGAGPFSAQQGSKQWQRVVTHAGKGKPRSCGDCHGEDLKSPGRHAKTGKRIEPMAPSVNPMRLTDAKKIEKWFKRNCKWTWGRVCTDQEKGDLLLYLQQQ